MKRFWVEGNFAEQGCDFLFWFSIEMAENEKEAIQKAIQRFNVDEYFHRDFLAYLIEENKDKIILDYKRVFPNIESILTYANDFQFYLSSSS